MYLSVSIIWRTSKNSGHQDINLSRAALLRAKINVTCGVQKQSNTIYFECENINAWSVVQDVYDFRKQQQLANQSSIIERNRVIMCPWPTNLKETLGA